MGAFGTSTTFVHFYGTSPPRMETLSLSGQSGVCKTRCVCWRKVDMPEWALGTVASPIGCHGSLSHILSLKVDQCCSPPPSHFIPLSLSGVTAYGSQAQALFGGAGAVAAAADATSGSGAVFVAAGSSLFRVTLAGSVARMGVIQDSASLFARVVPSGMTFVARNSQCVGAAATTQGAWH